MAQDTGQGFGVHTAGEGVGGEGMTQVVEADTGQPRPLEQRFHVEVGRAGVDRILRLHWVGEYPLTDGISVTLDSSPWSLSCKIFLMVSLSKYIILFIAFLAI